jgi:hypothetical protein
LDEEYLKELAEAWHVSIDEAEALLEALGEKRVEEQWGTEQWDWLDLDDVPVVGETPGGYDIPDPDYMADLAEDLDLDISDLYDLYYGYTPGEM